MISVETPNGSLMINYRNVNFAHKNSNNNKYCYTLSIGFREFDIDTKSYIKILTKVGRIG